MRRALFLLFALLGVAPLCLPAQTPPTPLTNLQNPGGGRIVFGPIGSQLTPRAAMAAILQRVHTFFGDRPQLGKPVQSPNGEILAVFFTAIAKNQDGRPVAGLAIVSAPQGGLDRAAVLTDYAERFPSTVNSMFALLKQQMLRAQPAPPNAASPAANPQSSAQPVSTGPAPAAPRLIPTQFPDGTGVIGLPSGWNLVGAKLGDVLAKGPRGETIRFGMTVAVIDPTNPQSRTLMGPNNRGVAPGNFVAIPYGTDPASAYKSAMTQLAQKNRKPAPAVNIANVQDIPMQGGKNYFLYGDIDLQDGQGKQSLVLQMINTTPLTMGTWQMTLYQALAPPQVMADDRSTIAAIFPSYSRDNRRVNSMVNDQIRQGIEQANQFSASIQSQVDASARTTQGFSDYLRGQSVILDTETGGHARTSDQLSDALIQANPNRFQSVPTSDYIKGLDY